MKVDDGARAGAFFVHGAMQEGLLGRRCAGQQLAVPVQLGQLRGIQRAQGAVGGRQQPAVVSAHADVAAASGGQPALMQRGAEAADFLAQPGLAHGSWLQALVKKSVAPKLPDLRASAMGVAPRLTVQGTPGSMVGPMRRLRTSSAVTTAPDVSPPATISCRTPAWTSRLAISDRASSTSAPARSTPSFSWATLTRSGDAVA